MHSVGDLYHPYLLVTSLYKTYGWTVSQAQSIWLMGNPLVAAIRELAGFLQETPCGAQMALAGANRSGR
jgi:hypothetical protein